MNEELRVLTGSGRWQELVRSGLFAADSATICDRLGCDLALSGDGDKTMRAIGLALALAALAGATSARAGDREDCSNAEAVLKIEPARAVTACRRLAEQGNVEAEVNLGAMYFNGWGVSPDYATAAKWYRKAADQGDPGAQYNMGDMCAHGWGEPQDYAEAAMWYQKAADQGDSDAQYNLGVIYAEGRGVPRSYVQAHMWWSLSAAGGDALAGKARDELAVRMTAAQIEQATALAVAWRQNH